MPATFGPQALPYPQASEAPDGPGAFLPLIQKIVVGGAIPFDTYNNMVAGLGTGYNGQLSVVYNDTIKNGLYWSNGSGWSLMTGPRQSATVAPNTAAGYSLGVGQVTLRGTSVTVTQQFTRGSAMVAADIVGTLPVGFRPPTTIVLPGGSTNSGAGNAMTFQVASSGQISIGSLGAGVLAGWVSGTFETF